MKNNKIHISEATGTSSGSRGSYNAPLSIGIRLFNKQAMQPYYVSTSEYDDARLVYDSYDDDGDVLNNNLGKLNEWIEIRDFKEDISENHNLRQIIKNILLQERKNP